MDISALWDANATRWLEAAGLTLLLYDHILTFPEEVSLLWPAPPSVAKYAFLFNRYLVLGILITIAYEFCGFNGNVLTDTGCKQFIFVVCMVAVVSVGIGNLLVLLRVVILWDHRPIVLMVMSCTYVVSVIAQLTNMVLMLIDVLPHVSWSPVAVMCTSTERPRLLVAVWASPMVFEAVVLVSTSLNALDRPTAAETPIVKALLSDGIGYFLAVTCLRGANVALASISRPSFTMIGVFFIWSMTTTVLNRSLLQFRHAEDQRWPDEIPLVIRAASPFALRDPRDVEMNISMSVLVYEDDIDELDE